MMTEEEVAQLIVILQAHFQKDLVNEEILVKSWQRALSDLTYPIAEKAVEEWLRIGKEFPASAHIRELAAEYLNPTMTADEAWGRIAKAALRFGHDETPDLPEEIMAVVQSLGGWRRVCLTDLEKVDLRKQFIFAYRAIQEKRKVFRDLSPLSGAGLPEGEIHPAVALESGVYDRGEGEEEIFPDLDRAKEIEQKVQELADKASIRKESRA